jgi:hypothetical protein
MEPIGAVWSPQRLRSRLLPPRHPRSGDTGWYLFIGRNFHDDLDLPDFEALTRQLAHSLMSVSDWSQSITDSNCVRASMA